MCYYLNNLQLEKFTRQENNILCCSHALNKKVEKIKFLKHDDVPFLFSVFVSFNVQLKQQCLLATQNKHDYVYFHRVAFTLINCAKYV